MGLVRAPENQEIIPILKCSCTSNIAGVQTNTALCYIWLLGALCTVHWPTSVELRERNDLVCHYGGKM